MTLRDPRRLRTDLLRGVLVLPLVVTASTGMLLSADPVRAADGIFTVTSTGDGVDKGTAANGVCLAADGTCTLRAALREAAAHEGGPATIRFAIPGSGTGPLVIAPQTKLPPLTNRFGTTIDGWSQPGSAPNTHPLADTGTIRIELRGKGSGTFDGLSVVSSDNVITGLAVYGFSKSIYVNGEATGVGGNRIVGNHICTDAAGTVGAATQQNPQLGVYVFKSRGNVIGAPGPANRNVISGCAHRGVTVSFTHQTESTLPGNKVQNNIVGLNPAGTRSLPNRSHGIDVNYNGRNVVGGTGFQERNVVSGNAGSGVEVSHSRQTQLNEVLGNFIGTDLTGASASVDTANKHYGIRMEGIYRCGDCTEDEAGEGVPHDNLVEQNVIVGSPLGGIHVDKGHHHDTIKNNKIGLTATGQPAGNGQHGIRIEHGARNILVVENEIAYNPRGVTIVGSGSAPGFSGRAPTHDNTITRNSIHDNTAMGIDLGTLGKINANGVGDLSVNHGMQAPTLVEATSTVVRGTATTLQTGTLAPCGGCTVEVFVADITTVGTGEGETYLASGTTAADGSFSVAVSGAVVGSTVTATATDPTGSTSEFARTRKVTTG